MTTGFSHHRNDPDPAPNAAKSVSEHWEHCAFKRIASFRSGAGFPIHHQGDHKADLPFFKVSDMNLAGNETVMAKHNNSVSHALAQELGATIFPPRTIIFPKVGGALLTNKRRVTTQHCCIDNNLMGCTVHRGNPEFVRLLLESIDLGEITKPGPVPAISESQVENIRVHLPPVDEQAAIVRYLDHADQLISRYIGAKERLIALLEEQRQAVIHRAVTRGLDPKVNLNPSGAHWIGNVPEHWKMCRAKQLFSPRRESARPDDIQLSATQAYGVIPQDEYEQRIGRKVVKISLHLDKRNHVEVDDFVISMRSFQGGLERAWATGCIRSSYIVLRPTSEVDVGFFSYLFKSQAYIQALQSTANFIRDGQDLNFNNFCAVDLPFPPAEEQKETAMALEQATADIRTNIARARRQIALVNEYRTRLIADAVTGQIDVRNAPVELPV